jgi:hypothetical protein
MSAPDELPARLIEWFRHPAVQALSLSPAIFWRGDARDPFGALKVDACELEVYFSALIGVPSTCLEAVNARTSPRASMPRGDFLVTNAHRHELPLFTRAV